MTARITAILFVLIPLAFILYLATYIVQEGEQAVITQFGKPVAYVTEPGLKFRIPLVQAVQRMEKRLLPWDGAPENMQTRDKKRIYVDCWARWKVSDLSKFYTTLRTERGGQKILDDNIDSGVRNVVAKHNLIDLVRTTNEKLMYESDELESTGINRDVVKTGRERIENEILMTLKADLMDQYGIELVDVHIKRVNYDDQVKATVYGRMRSEREMVARLFESEAEEERNRIKGLTQKELDTIDGKMKQKAAEIRGKADAEVIQLTAEAYGRNPEFFVFLKKLEVYKAAMKSDTNLILSTDNELLSLLKSMDELPRRKENAEVEE
ncbi:protease modulator HflC [Mariniblastus fucicola]|uniref:Protein HflC n=1 Tax=Mariniblastus fucicola TaxID=980251 RepID=A0A5B9P7P7_9BACT|nr:protease modulator HflC [Mariniblastus fucicola]QEG20962.1 Modulator of FtsH protease HflC [Mariniblastus fucicola]